MLRLCKKMDSFGGAHREYKRVATAIREIGQTDATSWCTQHDSWVPPCASVWLQECGLRRNYLPLSVGWDVRAHHDRGGHRSRHYAIAFGLDEEQSIYANGHGTSLMAHVTRSPKNICASDSTTRFWAFISSQMSVAITTPIPHHVRRVGWRTVPTPPSPNAGTAGRRPVEVGLLVGTGIAAGDVGVTCKEGGRRVAIRSRAGVGCG